MTPDPIAEWLAPLLALDAAHVEAQTQILFPPSGHQAVPSKDATTGHHRGSDQ
jgi:hypothetical protein